MGSFAYRHFGRRAVTMLARKGVRVVGLQALPDEHGSFLNSTTGYVVDDNGTSRVLTWAQVLQRAAS